jgi:hypothetical protein
MTGTMDWKLMRIMWWFPFIMQMKQLAQMQQQQQQPPPTLQQQQQDRLAAVSVDVSNSFRTNDPAYGGLEPSPSTNSTGMVKAAAKGAQSARKRKQTANSSGPANSSGTANTAGPSPNSAPSTPSTHTPADVMSMAGALQHNSSISKPLLMYGADGTATLASPSNQLADMDRFGEDGSLDDNVESFLSHEEADARESLFGTSKPPAGHNMDVSKGAYFFVCL